MIYGFRGVIRAVTICISSRQVIRAVYITQYLIFRKAISCTKYMINENTLFFLLLKDSQIFDIDSGNNLCLLQTLQ